jgi:branched-chain amino acid transport system ATP-binding protein
MLEVESIESSYGVSQVLFGVSLALTEGEAVTLIGRNGMGKTTTVKSIVGIVRPIKGVVLYRGHNLLLLKPHQIAALGIGIVPEGRQIFPNLTVKENLVATARHGVWRSTVSPWTLASILELFPALEPLQSRAGNLLSGGEQQMLAIARTLMTNPQLIILDEATEGLAPAVRGVIWKCVQQLKAKGHSLIVIDKDLSALNKVADRHYIIEKGRIVWTGAPSDLSKREELIDEFLAV